MKIFCKYYIIITSTQGVKVSNYLIHKVRQPVENIYISIHTFCYLNDILFLRGFLNKINTEFLVQAH